MESGTKGYFGRVLNEMNNLKQNATIEELNKLSFDRLNPRNGNLCIYGQMTDDCFSDRANELIKKCCKTSISFSHLSRRRSSMNKPRESKYGNLSFLEHCIANFGNNNKSIIQYLRGEISEINLSK